MAKILQTGDVLHVYGETTGEEPLVQYKKTTEITTDAEATASNGLYRKYKGSYWKRQETVGEVKTLIPVVEQTTGQSTTKTISQKGITDNFILKPGSYTGQAGKYFRVTQNEQGVEFVNSPVEGVLAAGENDSLNRAIKSSVNRFNPAAITPDVFINQASGNTAVGTGMNVVTSDYMPVFQGESVATLGHMALVDGQRKFFFAFYDANKVFLSSTNGALDEGKVLAPPAGTAYIRVSVGAGFVNTLMVLFSENMYLPAYYIPYNKATFQLDNTNLRNLNVKAAQTDFIDRHSNLFNAATVTPDTYVNYQYGQLVAFAGRSSSAFIPVKPGHLIRLVGNPGGINYYAWYTHAEGSSYVSKQGATTWGTGYVTVPSDVYFIRFTMVNADVNTIMLLQGRAPGVQPHEPDRYRAFGDVSEFVLPSLVPSSVSEGAEDAAVYTRNVALYDSIVDGKRLDTNSNNLIDDVNQCCSTAYYPVSQGDVIYTRMEYGEGNNLLKFYNSLKTPIANHVFNSSALQVTVPANAAFARVSFSVRNKRNKLFSVNSSDMTYVRGQKIIPDQFIYGGKSMFSGLRWYAVGDSITAQQWWQPHVLNRYRLNFTNLGIGGQKLSGADGMWHTAFLSGGANAIGADAQFVTLMGGANDWGGSVAMGASDSTDTGTLMGGFNTFITRFYEDFPDKILIVMSPTLCYKVQDGSQPFEGYVNNEGYDCYDVADAIEARCKALGIPYVDIIRNYGVNQFNHAIYTPDRVHPNALGGEKIAGVLMGYMHSIDNFKN